MTLLHAEAGRPLTFALPTLREAVSCHFPPVNGSSLAGRIPGTGAFSLVSSATDKGDAKLARRGSCYLGI